MASFHLKLLFLLICYLQNSLSAITPIRKSYSRTGKLIFFPFFNKLKVNRQIKGKPSFNQVRTTAEVFLLKANKTSLSYTRQFVNLSSLHSRYVMKVSPGQPPPLENPYADNLPLPRDSELSTMKNT